MDKKSHRLSYKNKKIVHWQNKVENDITFSLDGTAFILLKNHRYSISKNLVEQWKIESDNWKNDIDISLGIYEINLQAKIQTNLLKTNF